jgi:MFS family permease
MLSSITPLGERGRGNRWALTVTVYVVASAAGGLAAGTVLGLAGLCVRIAARPPAAALFSVIAFVCLATLALELRPGARLTTTRRQVNERWLDDYRGWVYGGGFGFQLGLGLVTIVTSAAVFAMAALALLAGLAGSLGGAMIVGTVFGLARALPILSFAGVRDWHSLQRRHQRLHTAAASARLTAAGTLGAVAVAAVALALSRA